MLSWRPAQAPGALTLPDALSDLRVAEVGPWESQAGQPEREEDGPTFHSRLTRLGLQTHGEITFYSEYVPTCLDTLRNTSQFNLVEKRSCILEKNCVEYHTLVYTK